MNDFIIKVEDKVAKVSPLCEQQLDPTGLNLIHPSKHIAPTNDKNFKDFPFSLFLNIEQRDKLLSLISSNRIVKDIILDKVEKMGGNFRIFMDIRLKDLMRVRGDDKIKYWSYCKNTQKHQKKRLAWVSIAIDFAPDMQSNDKMTANLQTIFPLETENRLLPNESPSNNRSNDEIVALKNYDDTMIFMELLCPFYTEKIAYSVNGIALKVYDYSTQPFSLLRRWDNIQSPHSIFFHADSKFNEQEVRKNFLSSFRSLPFPSEITPDLERMKGNLVIEFENLKLSFSKKDIRSHLLDLGFELSDLEGFTQKIVHFNGELYDSQTNDIIKEEINTATKLIDEVNSAAIKNLAKNHFPQVERTDLITVYTKINERFTEGEELARVDCKGREFEVSDKNKKAFGTMLNELKNYSITDDKIIGRAVNMLIRSMKVDGQVICKHPKLAALLDLVRTKKILLENVQRSVLTLQKAQDDFTRITISLEHNKKIQSRNIDSPLKEITTQLEIMADSEEIDSAMVSLLKTHLRTNAENYAVTKAMDNQMHIFAMSLKEGFLKKLTALIVQVVKDNNEALPLFISKLELKNKAIFFRDKTDATKFEPNKELVKICSDKSFEKFCEIIGETRLLITAINNYLIKNGLKNEKQNKYDELIKNLANAIQNFYDFRQCHPYVFFSLVDEQQRLPTPYQAKRFLELIVSGLRQRLLYEQKYSEVLKAPPSASVHQEKIFILSNFLQDTGRLFLPLESTEKALEIIQNVLTLSIEKSEGYFSQSPSLVLFRPTGEQGRQSRLKKSSNSKTNCFERSSELVNP